MIIIITIITHIVIIIIILVMIILVTVWVYSFHCDDGCFSDIHYCLY